MRRRVLGSFLVFLMVLPSFASAQRVQQARVVRVGVVLQRSVNGPVVNWTSNARWRSDLLVNYLNQHKPGKNSQVRLEAVPLASLSSREIYSEARDKGCEYVVVMWDNSSESHGPENSFEPETSFLEAYSLRRVSDGAWPPGSVTGEWIPDRQALYDAIVKAATP
jgi:hypothetical protein